MARIAFPDDDQSQIPSAFSLNSFPSIKLDCEITFKPYSNPVATQLRTTAFHFPDSAVAPLRNRIALPWLLP
ncbi:hypothetical protein AUJ65_04365 [Candidatus Micrarchaeota archaeon CG1_02_51_15]|nr:MAG: hypothetical protein AUJ65_04365 [Candidatus Micrarchaeota archaeon CG1_02_51_15]